ncbi:hypothetical protein BDZ89DRAFT_1025314 [Hymenopellis radicata]|nr:hypothetical protein BDZ89DRAFT_1025314 [Hymenopellis radicata]
MLASTVQPPIISLFSSTGSNPLGLFLSAKDDSLPEDSCIMLVNDASGESFESGSNDSRAKLISPPSVESAVDEGRGYSLSQTVLHLQSPTMRTTFIQSHGDLGIKHPWIHLQVRNMGREWGFEVGVVDQSKRRGTVRLSTFQSVPRLHPATGDKPALLHLPLAFPRPSAQALTAWSTIAIRLPSLLPYFSDQSLVNEENNSIGIVPSGTYAYVSHVKIYATCRLRRIWFSEAGPSQALPEEFQLYSSS